MNPVLEQCQAGSLTGAVASQRVTEARKGSLSAVGNRTKSVNVEGSLTARSTDRAGTKVGVSDPAVPNGRAVAQRIKGTPGITVWAYVGKKQRHLAASDNPDEIGDFYTCGAKTQ